MVKFCPECGHPIINSKMPFCPKCGAKLPITSTESQIPPQTSSVQQQTQLLENLLKVSTVPTTISELLQSANNLSKSERYPEALPLLQSILTLDPNNEAALREKSAVLFKLKRYADAITVYNKILLKYPEDSVIWNNKGVALDCLGKYQESVAAYDKSLKIDPNYTTAKTNRDTAIKKIELANKKRQEKLGTPIKSAPTLFTVWGIGARMWGDTHYFTIFWIPFIPIARYSIEPHPFLAQLPFVSGNYKFYGKLELHPWQKTWQLVIIGILIGLVISVILLPR